MFIVTDNYGRDHRCIGQPSSSIIPIEEPERYRQHGLALVRRCQLESQNLLLSKSGKRTGTSRNNNNHRRQT